MRSGTDIKGNLQAESYGSRGNLSLSDSGVSPTAYINENLRDEFSPDSCLSMLQDLLGYNVTIYPKGTSYFRGKELSRSTSNKTGKKFVLTPEIMSGIKNDLWQFCMGRQGARRTEDYDKALDLARLLHIKSFMADEIFQRIKIEIDVALKRKAAIHLNKAFQNAVKIIRLYDIVQNILAGQTINIRQDIYGEEFILNVDREKFLRGNDILNPNISLSKNDLKSYLAIAYIKDRLKKINGLDNKSVDCESIQWLNTITLGLLSEDSIKVEIEKETFKVSVKEILKDQDFMLNDKALAFENDSKKELRQFYWILLWKKGEKEAQEKKKDQAGEQRKKIKKRRLSIISMGQLIFGCQRQIRELIMPDRYC
ncbi:MAG: hypothetical protein JSS53_03680 [Proteobacteria bacterium]|nr:hypothetical protein [Pseudomonadota bacterium]